MREVILDTETTGLDPAQGHRLVEIGCLELINTIPTGKTFHAYLDPERDMPDEAFRIHGLSAAFLTGQPVFASVVAAFLAFVGQDRLVIHNAEFDMRFINSELKRINLAPIAMTNVIDTLLLARRKHPGSPVSLDALCARYHISTARRTRHGALLDSELLAEVYVELTGGHQTAMSLAHISGAVASGQADDRARAPIPARPSALPRRSSAAEAEAHATFVAELGANSVWQSYRPK